jgi:nicotinate-nucleotide adenylyltransferase
MSSPNVGIFGGSFDPIHAGHVAPVRAALRRLGLERVLYVVTADPPHKPRRALAPAWARYAMVELALLDEPGLFASALELTPGRPCYTVDTLRQLRAQHPDWNLFLLLGADSYRDLETWREWREIASLARLVVLARPGVQAPPEAAAAATWIDDLPVDLSSTALRAALGRGGAPTADLLHPRVLQYVRKHNLYRE